MITAPGSTYRPTHSTLSQNKTAANSTRRQALSYDVGFQDAPTVLVIASDWSESRGGFRLAGVSIWRSGEEVKSKKVQAVRLGLGYATMRSVWVGPVTARHVSHPIALFACYVAFWQLPRPDYIWDKWPLSRVRARKTRWFLQVHVLGNDLLRK